MTKSIFAEIPFVHQLLLLLNWAAQTLVTSQLDNYNMVYMGLPFTSIQNLLLLRNAAAVSFRCIVQYFWYMSCTDFKAGFPDTIQGIVHKVMPGIGQDI